MSYSKRSEKFKKLIMIRKVLENESKQFPEAMCDCATRLIYEEFPFITIMNGSFKGTQHVWAYDMEQKVHIDITLDQFNPEFGPINILNTDEAIIMGYELGTLSDWGKLFENNFLSLNKDFSGNKTMRNVLRSLKRTKTRSRFKFW
jgi:hypothetical protein